MKISSRDLFFGICGTLLGGIVVWLVTKNIELGAQLTALETINPQVTAAVSASSSAETSSREALRRANEALHNVKAAEAEASRILASINATPLFEKVDESIGALRDVAADVAKEEVARMSDELREELRVSSRWPHAISCGSQWAALFVLHGHPADGESGFAWYFQTYADENRYVRFSADGSYYDRAGHSDSSIGCENKSIKQLRREQRAFQFLRQ